MAHFSATLGTVAERRKKPMQHFLDRISRIESLLEKLPNSGSVTVMPDYFVDRFVRVDSLDNLVNAIKKKSVEGGGGSIRGVVQFETKGGNGVNFGSSLAKFNANVNVIAIAESIPEQMLRASFEQMKNAKLYVVKGKPGFTTAIEFLDGDRRVNVMLSDIGDLIDFDGSKLQSSYWKIISESKAVAVVNWSSNRKGTELCEIVFESAKKNGAITFFDPADISGQADRLPEFKKRILDTHLLDVMSLNENEIRIICREMCRHDIPTHYSQNDLVKALDALSSISDTIIDLHTSSMSYTCTGRDIVSVPCQKVVQKTVTGAGDVWNAADLAGYLTRMNAEDRLSFANAAAGLYISRENAEPPSTEEVLGFMKAQQITAAQ